MGNRARLIAWGLIAPLVLAGCERSSDEPRAQVTDPAIAGALADEIMIDPDLVRQQGRNSALGGGGPAQAQVPPEDAGPDAAAAARAEAEQLAGRIEQAPAPKTGGSSGAGATAALTANGALAETGSAKDCVAGLEYSAVWAARLPAALPVYPRGHVQEAAGTDKPGCRLRVVNYLTPVSVDDVVNFYWTRARAAGLAPLHRSEGTDRVIGGGAKSGVKSGQAAFVAYVRERGGITEVDLVTNGW